MMEIAIEAFPNCPACGIIIVPQVNRLPERGSL